MSSGETSLRSDIISNVSRDTEVETINQTNDALTQLSKGDSPPGTGTSGLRTLFEGTPDEGAVRKDATSRAESRESEKHSSLSRKSTSVCQTLSSPDQKRTEKGKQENNDQSQSSLKSAVRRDRKISSRASNHSSKLEHEASAESPENIFGGNEDNKGVRTVRSPIVMQNGPLSAKEGNKTEVTESPGGKGRGEGSMKSPVGYTIPQSPATDKSCVSRSSHRLIDTSFVDGGVLEAPPNSARSTAAHRRDSITTTSINIDLEVDVSSVRSGSDSREETGRTSRDGRYSVQYTQAKLNVVKENNHDSDSTQLKLPPLTKSYDLMVSEQDHGDCDRVTESRKRSRSVGNRVRFIGHCCVPSSGGGGNNQPDSPFTCQHQGRSRRFKRKLYKSASVGHLEGDMEMDRNSPRQGYSTLLKEIQHLMSEVQQQREDFRTELRSLTSSISRRPHYWERRGIYSSDKKVHRAPRRLVAPTHSSHVIMADQEATKETKKEEVKEEKPKEEAKTKEDKKDDKSDTDGRSTPGDRDTPEPRSQENGDPDAAKPLTLREQFRHFSKFGDTKSDGKMLTLSQSDKWFKQAKVIDGKTLTTTDTAITFNKFKSKKITFTDFEKYLDEISKSKKLDSGEIRRKLQDCGAPGTSGTTSVVKSSALDRLTDTKKFTGSHKLRFDSTGRGKGIAGRKDVSDNSGYVTGYRNKNTYDKSH